MNVFDKVVGTEHVVAESSRLKATTAGHIYDLKMTKDLDNGTIVAIGDFVEEQVWEAADFADGKKPYLLLTPPLAYNGRKSQSAEKYFYNAKGEIARAYELHIDDIFTVSAKAFAEAPEVGDVVNATYATGAKAEAGKFAAEVISEVNYFNGASSKSYRLRVLSV